MAEDVKKVVLQRFESSEEGTFGRINCGNFNCFSLERPVVVNRPNLDAIPSGVYMVTWTYSPHFKRPMYLVKEVKGRSGVRIHSANLTSQLNGCISLGSKLGKLGGKKALLLSKPAIRQFEQLMDKKDFILEIC